MVKAAAAPIMKRLSPEERRGAGGTLKTATGTATVPGITLAALPSGSLAPPLGTGEAATRSADLEFRISSPAKRLPAWWTSSWAESLSARTSKVESSAASMPISPAPRASRDGLASGASLVSGAGEAAETSAERGRRSAAAGAGAAPWIPGIGNGAPSARARNHLRRRAESIPGTATGNHAAKARQTKWAAPRRPVRPGRKPDAPRSPAPPKDGRRQRDRDELL